jgi:ribosomal protein S18 acetylase RimI-like enzyme
MNRSRSTTTRQIARQRHAGVRASQRRRHGLAKALMTELEATASRLGCTLLVMDTRKGGEAEKMCESLGYVPCDEIPGYARSGNGALHTTVFFYRQL